VNHAAFVVGWMIAFAQNALYVLGFLSAWVINGWMVSCAFDTSRPEAKIFSVSMAVNALRNFAFGI